MNNQRAYFFQSTWLKQRSQKKKRLLQSRLLRITLVTNFTDFHFAKHEWGMQATWIIQYMIPNLLIGVFLLLKIRLDSYWKNTHPVKDTHA